MTRADPPIGLRAERPQPPPAVARDRQRLWWIPLGLMVAAVWALFLNGLR